MSESKETHECNHCGEDHESTFLIDFNHYCYDCAEKIYDEYKYFLEAD